MSILVDVCSVAPVALTRDALPRLLSRSPMPIADLAWRRPTGTTERGFEAAQQMTQDGRTAVAGAAYVTAHKHFSIRSGPPTRRP